MKRDPNKPLDKLQSERGKLGGRPPFPIEDHLDAIERLSGIGCPVGDIAHIIGCSPPTIYQYTADAESPVSLAIARGRARAAANVGTTLYKKAVGGDLGAIRWWESTRAGRGESKSDDRTPEEVAARIRETLAAMREADGLPVD